VAMLCCSPASIRLNACTLYIVQTLNQISETDQLHMRLGSSELKNRQSQMVPPIARVWLPRLQFCEGHRILIKMPARLV
jgi:hypothetical protein